MVLLKIALAPILIGLVSLAERKWGNRVSGLLVGMPLTSGPVLFILALEYGSAFASRAAVGCLLGQFALAAFTLTYARVARSLKWIASLLVGVIVYLVIAAALLKLPMSDAVVFTLVCIVLAVTLTLFPSTPAAAGRPVAMAKRELLMRMAVAAGIVVLLTTAARVLGAEVAGLLAPFPVYTGILAVFNHVRSADAAVSVMKGVTTGAFGATTFCGVVMAGTSLPRGLCFTLAVLAAFGAQLVIYPFARQLGQQHNLRQSRSRSLED
jgi:hypothetical protein